MLTNFTGSQKGQQCLTLIYKKPNSNQFQRTPDEVWWPFELLQGQKEPSRVSCLPPLLLARGDCSSSHHHSPPRPRRTRRTSLTGTAGAGGSRTVAARTCQGHHSSSGWAQMCSQLSSCSHQCTHSHPEGWGQLSLCFPLPFFLSSNQIPTLLLFQWPKALQGDLNFEVCWISQDPTKCTNLPSIHLIFWGDIS